MTGCILWWGNVSPKGYGRAWRPPRLVLAHRLVYEECFGPIPEGTEIDHLCRHRTCVNPEHLEAVTHKVNMERSARGRQTHCVHGHPFDKVNTRHAQWGERRFRVCRTCHRERTRERRVRTR